VRRGFVTGTSAGGLGVVTLDLSSHPHLDHAIVVG
jgi:hypothetical protein